MGVKQRLTDDGEVSGQKHLDSKVILNVGGGRHESWLSTLENFPGTRLALLAHLKEEDESYDVESKEYFFDRHPKAFENILQYYRTEELHVDQSVCGNLMKKELSFWGIEESEIEPCCWSVYSKHTEHKKTLEDLDENFAYVNHEAWDNNWSKLKIWQYKTWEFLENPNSSRAAKIYAVVSMFFVALSISIFVLETHKMFQIDINTNRAMIDIEPTDAWAPTGSLLSCCCEPEFNATSTTPVTHPVLFYLDYICVGFFTFELLLRFSVCPHKGKFFRDVMNIIDVVCLVPYIISTVIRTISMSNPTANVLKTVLMIRIVRILRIFKLMKHYSAFKILVYTLKVSTKELFLMVVFLMTGVLMFASLIHYIEKENFPNIPIGIWWALVTMTTVGYGDKYTVTIPGYVIGSLCVISGVLVIAFTVPIVVNNFSLYYSHAQTRIKAPIKRKRKQDKPGGKISNFLRQRGIMKKLKDLEKNDDEQHVFDSIPNTSKESSEVSTGESSRKNNKDVKQRAPKKDKPKSLRLDKPSNPANRRDLAVEDLDSFDSGFDELQSSRNKNKEKYEAESKKIVENLITTEQKQEEERKRQEWLIKRKRQIRARLKETAATTPRDIQLKEANSKSGEGSYKANDESHETTS